MKINNSYAIATQVTKRQEKGTGFRRQLQSGDPVKIAVIKKKKLWKQQKATSRQTDTGG